MLKKLRQKRPMMRSCSIALSVSQSPILCCLQLFIYLIKGAHQNTLENIPLVFVTYVCIIISRNSDNIILAAQLLPDSSSPCSLHPVVPCGTSRGSLILEDILQEIPARWVPVLNVFFELVLMNIAARVFVVFLGHFIADW
jgi:hypothetical protein